jgi:hypothetical protein
MTTKQDHLKTNGLHRKGLKLQSNNVLEDYYYHHHYDDTEIYGLFQFYAFQAYALQPEWLEVMLRSEEVVVCWRV